VESTDLIVKSMKLNPVYGKTVWYVWYGMFDVSKALYCTSTQRLPQPKKTILKLNKIFLELIYI
jgi:hypothetical protein